MEVEPSVLKVVVLLFQLFIELCEFSSYPKLGTLLVDQINHELFLVLRPDSLGALKMGFSSQFRVHEVFVDLHRRRPFQVWLHSPQQRNGASNLNV